MPRKKKPREPKTPMETPGFAWRIGVSIIMFFALVIFLIIWLFFYASSFDVYQNIAVIIASLLVFIGVMAASWVSWGIKWGKKFENCDK